MCAAVLSGALILSAGMPVPAVLNRTMPGMADSVTAAEPEEDADLSGNVYVEADADGTVRKITASEGLEDNEKAAELPVSVNVSYYLNGEKMNPEQMAGASGEVKIRFDYENLTSEQVEIDGKNVEVQVPFMVISAAILPTDVFSNVEVSNGKIIAGDEQNIAAGIAFPGMAESLKLRDYEPTEEVSVPDYIEVTADVTDFELELTATIVTPCGLSDMDTEELDDVDELVDAMDALTDASSQLVSGMGELSDGMNAFQSYLSAYMEGVDQVNEGAKALADGLAVLDTSKGSLVEGAAALQSGLENLRTALAQISIPSGNGEEMQKAAEAAAMLKKDSEMLSELSETIREQFESVCAELGEIDLEEAAAAVDAEATRQAQEQAKAETTAALDEVLGQIDDTELPPEIKQKIADAMGQKTFEGIQITGTTEGIRQQMEAAEQKLKNAAEQENLAGAAEVLNDMQTQLGILASYGESIAELAPQITSLNAALGELNNGVGQLASGSGQLVQGITALDSGIGEAGKGAAALSSGVSELASAGSQLSSGFSILTAGTSALREGMVTFDREGVQEISKLAGKDLTEVLTRFKALKEAEARYTQKVGTEENGVESIKYIIETEEISK